MWVPTLTLTAKEYSMAENRMQLSDPLKKAGAGDGCAILLASWSNA